MAALVVEACSKKKGKVDGPNESKMILLGYYIKFGPKISRVTRISWDKRLRHGEQINRNFGIKLFYPKIGGHMFPPKFRKKNVRTRSFQDCVIEESIA